MYADSPRSADASYFPQEYHHEAGANNKTRQRSMSLSLLWRRPKSSYNTGDDLTPRFRELALEKSKSHGFARSRGQSLGPASLDAPGPSRPVEQPLNFKGMIRRASLSVKSGVKGIVQRRTSVPAPIGPFEYDDPYRHRRLAPSLNANNNNTYNNRPTTAQTTWHRLRQAASFHRHSRLLHTGYDDRPFNLEPIESPTFPVPGSGEQPPIIPRNTGAAARQAAASAYREVNDFGPTPKPNWLAPEEGLDDYESGIGIALTSSEIEIYVPSAEVDSDVDVGLDGDAEESHISKIDFVSELPIELAIQVLAYLDAAALASASRVSKQWGLVVANQHVWRESFLREKTTTYATSGPVKPGVGLGIPALRPGNDWKEIYRVKEELDRRWKEGKARPVYLNGHSDSIYCLQFDEYVVSLCLLFFFSSFPLTPSCPPLLETLKLNFYHRSKIVTGSRDKTVRVWDMQTFTCKLVIGPPEVINDPTLSLLYDEDGNLVHYATLPESDSSPPLANNNNGLPPPPARAHQSTPALVSFPTHHNASILCLQYDDHILVTGSSDATCIVYNLRSGYRPIRRLRHHSAAVLDLVFDSRYIVTCSKDISICVWDRETGNLVRQLRGHSGPVNAVQMRGNTIVSCSGDFRVKLWNIDTGKNIREFSGHTKGLACSQFSEDGRYVASAGNDKVIRIWDANTGECVREMRAHDNLVRSLHVDSVSGRLVSGSYDTDIKVFDMESGRQLLDFPRWHNSWVLSAKSDYRRIVSTGQDPKILVMDFGAGVRGVEMLETRNRVAANGSVADGGYI